MKKLHLFIMLLMAAMLPLAVQAQSTLTVNDGTATNSNVPIYGLYVDSYLKCEYVIPASELEDMGVGSSISAMTFYLSSVATASWGSANFQVFMKEVAATTIDAFTGLEDATLVYEGSLDGTQSEMTVEFTTNYTYNGGNLLVGFYNTVIGTYKSASFYGVSATGACVQGYSGSSLADVSPTQRNFLPKTTFTYSGGAPVACARPTELEFSNLTATSVDLSWTAGGSETEWTLEVNGTEMTGITANPYTLTVNPATNYTVKVKANCSATEISNWSNTVSFTTPCATITVTETSPFMEDFNTLTAGIPNCWDNTDGTTTSSTSKWSYYATGASGACVRFNSYFNSNGNTNMLKTPVLDITQLTNPYVTFNYKNPTGGDFSVFVSTDGGATYTTALATGLTGVSDWTQQAFVLNGLDATDNVVIVFQGTSNYGSGDAYIYLDDVTVGEAPACVAPNGLAANNVTATSADIAWTANNGETEWTIEVNGTEMTGITENPYTLTTTANTEYTVRVKANCSATEESDWSSAFTFHTPCETTVVTEENPFSEDFNTLTAGIPTCWDNTDGTTSTDSYKWNYYATDTTGACVRFNSWTNSTGNTNMLKTPALDVTALTMPYLTFNYKNPTGGDFSVFVSTDGGATYTTALATGLTGASDWTPMSILLNNLTATDNVVIVFQGTSNWGSGDAYIYLDDVLVGEAPSCIAPSDVTIDAVTTTTATISWTDNNETAPQSWTIDLNGEETEVTTNPYTFDNLTAATIYTVKVKANCTDDDESAWSSEVAFTTECDVIVVTAANPYQEGFENEGICWTIEQEDEADAWWIGEGSNAYEGTHYAVAPYTPGNVTRLVSPVLDLTQLANPVLSYQHFQAYYQSVSLDVLTVYYRTSETSEWVLLADFADSSYTAYAHEVHELPEASATYQISFLASSNDGYNILLDDVNVFDSVAEPCATPTNVTFANGVVTWTGNAANYNVHIVAGETTIDTTVNTTSYTVEGLNNGDHATVTVQAICAEDDLSEWSEAVEFDYTNGINNYSLKANIYPNPTTGNVTVESDAINADITVFDAFGKLMMTSKVATERTELNFSEFAPGVYMVRIANDTAISTIKVVKK